MKIGILTWWRNHNYGASLQAIALEQMLLSLGYDVELIDFDRQRCSISIWSFLFQIRDWVTSGFILETILRLFRTQRFLKQYARVSQEHFGTYASLCSEEKYDTIIVGSDQVWNPLWFDKSKSFLLKDIPASTRKISYAASIAEEDISAWQDDFREALSSFKGISIRERTQLEQLKKIISREVAWVVDPTQLLSAEEWKTLLNLQVSNKQHIVVYWISRDEKLIEETIRLKKKYREDILIYSDLDVFRFRFQFHSPLRSLREYVRHLILLAKLTFLPGIHYKKSADAKTFLQDIYNANVVLTDSFHGLMFSVKFKKDVKVLIPAGGIHMQSRLIDFIFKIQGENIKIGEVSQFDHLPCAEYDSRLLEDWIGYSRNWLIEQIEG